MQDLGHHMFYGPGTSMTSVSGDPASGSLHDLIVREVENLPEPYAIPCHCTVPNHIMTQSSRWHTGVERSFSNHGYHQQLECEHNLHPQPHCDILQQRSNFSYQHPQWNVGHQSSSPHLSAVRISGLQTSQLSQHVVVAAQQMVNQGMGPQPNQLRNINAFRESFQKTNYATSYAQLLKEEQSRTIDPQQLQFNENEAIQESQGPTRPVSVGTKDSPIMVSEDSAEWLDSVYQKIQKCKEDCLPDVLKIHRHFVSQIPQNIPEEIVKMVLQVEDMIKLLNLQRSSMQHKVEQNVYRRIEQIYVFTRRMRKTRPMLFAGPSEGSNSLDHGEQQMLPPAIREDNHTHNKQYLLQQEAAAGSEAENNAVSPLQPAKTSADTGEAMSQSSPIDRLIKAVNEASAETLISSAQDILAVTSATARMNETAAYENGRTYSSDNLAALTNYNLHTKQMQDQRIKRNFEVVGVHNFNDMDDLIDSGFHMLDGLRSSTEKAKRRKIEENKNLMNEIEFLNGKLIETEVVIVKPDSGSPPTLEAGSEITVLCTFRATGSMAFNEFCNLFPVRMLLKIPGDYPQSQLATVSCRHQGCGEMCAWLQMKYERWSQSYDLTSVTEIVQGWDACARELYTDICLGSGRGSHSAKFGT